VSQELTLFVARFTTLLVIFDPLHALPVREAY
jgi:hypothetical protein